MALVSILLPAFFFEDDNDIQKQVSKQLGMKFDQFQICSVYPTQNRESEQDHPFQEFAIKMVQSDLSLRRIEGILEEQYITQKKVDKCREALTTLALEFNNSVQSPGLKDLDTQLQKRTKKLKQVREDNRKLRQLLKAQLENSEKIRIETQTTVETLREEFDLLVRELSNIQKKEIEGISGGNQYGQVQQNYIIANNKMSNQQNQQQGLQQQYQQQQQQQQQQINGNNSNQNVQEINLQFRKFQQQQTNFNSQQQQQGQQNLQQPNINNLKQQNEYSKGNYLSQNQSGQQQAQQVNQMSLPLQKLYIGQQNLNMQIGSFGNQPNNNSNNNSGHNSNNLSNNQNIPLQVKNINSNNFV
ncbi:hypothetical protein ABPG72_009484 [Tetrahymena utriculariae]